MRAATGRLDTSAAAPATTGGVIDVLDECVRAALAARPVVDDVVARARRRAAAAHAAAATEPEATRLAAAAFVSEVFNGVWLEVPWQLGDATALAQELASASGLGLVTLGLETLSHPGLLQLPPEVAVRTHLGILAAFAPAQQVAFWSIDGRGRVECALRLGGSRLVAGGRAFVEDVLAAPPAVSAVRGVLVAAPVLRWQQPHAVVLVQARRGHEATCAALVERAALMLAPLLERQDILVGGARAEHVLGEATERRLTRLGLDLHDGPLQTVAAVAQEVDQLKRRFAGLVPDERPRALALGWLADLESRLEALEEELRSYSSSLGSPLVLRHPLPAALEEALERFRRRSSMRVHMATSGSLDGLTQSQQIAILRVVTEGLANAAAHSGAGEVRVSVSGKPTHIVTTVFDDGVGFNMERTLVRAASAGRLGLLGMDERIRLLGGTFTIRSREGGPTELSATLPRWEPTMNFKNPHEPQKF